MSKFYIKPRNNTRLVSYLPSTNMGLKPAKKKYRLFLCPRVFVCITLHTGQTYYGESITEKTNCSYLLDIVKLYHVYVCSTKKLDIFSFITSHIEVPLYYARFWSAIFSISAGQAILTWNLTCHKRRYQNKILFQHQKLKRDLVCSTTAL